MPTQHGYLILADISGYTFFLTQSELEHANMALSYLLEAMIEKMGAALTIAKLEGDAVFAYVEEDRLSNGESLLDLIDQTYLAFRDKALSLYEGATCNCQACQCIPTLDLKFLVHHGDFILQQVAGIKDLLGADVTLVHRLMKNNVTEATGWRGYALFTRQGLEHIRADKKGFLQQSESYEHLGDVETYVIDLNARYAALKAA